VVAVSLALVLYPLSISPFRTIVLIDPLCNQNQKNVIGIGTQHRYDPSGPFNSCYH